MKWPKEFLSKMQDYFGVDYDNFLNGLSESAPVSIRMNTKKVIQPFENSSSILWSNHGLYLDQRPSFTLDPLFHAGC